VLTTFVPTSASWLPILRFHRALLYSRKRRSITKAAGLIQNKARSRENSSPRLEQKQKKRQNKPSAATTRPIIIAMCEGTTFVVPTADAVRDVVVAEPRSSPSRGRALPAAEPMHNPWQRGHLWPRRVGAWSCELQLENATTLD